MPSMRAVKPNPAPCKSSSTSKSRSQLERIGTEQSPAQPSDELPVGVNNRVEDDGWSDCDHGGTDSGRDGGVECVRLARGGWSAQEEAAIEESVAALLPTDGSARGKVITRSPACSPFIRGLAAAAAAAAAADPAAAAAAAAASIMSNPPPLRAPPPPDGPPPVGHDYASPPPPRPTEFTCSPCNAHLTNAPRFCGVLSGHTVVYGAEAPECERFEQEAASFDSMITGWMAPPPAPPASNTSASPPPIHNERYPGCRDALATFFCAQQPILQASPSNDPSACSDYRRPYHDHGRCLAFCLPIRDACPYAAWDHCETTCRMAAFTSFCPVLRVTGLDEDRWDEDTLDIENLYRLEAEADVPLLRDGRPYYRSIPARRPEGSSRTTKLDYYLYATRTRGYTEWLIDTNDVDSDGAKAVVSDATLVPYRINSDWTVWEGRTEPIGEWTTAPLRISCREEEEESAGVRRVGSSSSGISWVVSTL